jgi:hypothetical protein
MIAMDHLVAYTSTYDEQRGFNDSKVREIRQRGPIKSISLHVIPLQSPIHIFHSLSYLGAHFGNNSHGWSTNITGSHAANL